MLDVHIRVVLRTASQPDSQPGIMARPETDRADAAVLAGVGLRLWLSQIHLICGYPDNSAGVNRVWRLMKHYRDKGLQVEYRSHRARKGETSIVTPARLSGSSAEAPDERWVTDITYIPDSKAGCIIWLWLLTLFLRAKDYWLVNAAPDDKGYCPECATMAVWRQPILQNGGAGSFLIQGGQYTS